MLGKTFFRIWNPSNPCLPERTSDRTSSGDRDGWDLHKYCKGLVSLTAHPTSTSSGAWPLPFEELPPNLFSGQADECCNVGYDLPQCADSYVAMSRNRDAMLTGCCDQCNRHVTAPAPPQLVAELAIQ